MTRTFIQTSEFSKNWEQLGFSDDDLRRLDFVVAKTVYLITVYQKKDKDNLSKNECKEIKKMIEVLEKNL